MIVVDRVTKFYGAHPAVRELTFRIEQGECVGFLGLNGAGKSTTLKLLSCLLLPTSGRVTIRGLDAEVEPHEIRKFIGFLPETPPVYPEMTVAEYVRFAGLLRGLGRAALAKRLGETLEATSLTAVADQVISTLSHGYRQRVGIAQAIVHDPALLILDEPIQGLDPVQIVEMRELIRRLRGKHTILVSSHILSEIERTCDRILMLNEGRIAADGTEDQLLERFGGGHAFEVDVRGDGERLGAITRGVPGVTSCDVSPAFEGVARAVIRGETDLRAAVAKAVVGAGLELVRLERGRTGLEAIFVELSRGRTAPAVVVASPPGTPEATA